MRVLVLCATACILGALLVAAPPAQAQNPPVIISEFLAINDSGPTDADGDTSDWIELHNTSGQAVNLAGWELADGSSQWVFGSVTIAADDYLVVFASGKNRRTGELHTDFKLSGSGENLTLRTAGLEVASAFTPYPAQHADLSYGVSGGTTGYMTPTPGQANGSVGLGPTAAPTASIGRSIQTGAFTETLTSSTPGAEFHYTTNGATPTLASTKTSGTVAINPTAALTVLTAIAKAPGYEASEPVRIIYVNSAVVANSIGGGATVQNGLAEAPIVAITSANGQEPSSERWEQAQLELIDIDGKPGFSVPVGAKRVGNWSLNSAKPSFRFNFSADFGQTQLEYPLFEGYGNEFFEPATSYDKIEVRGFSADGWVHPNGRGLFISNEWARETVADLGTASPLDRPASVFLNGQFMGFYSLREFPDGDWHTQYVEGDLDDHEWWNIKGHLDQEELNGGAGTAWPIVRDALDYQQVKDLVDPRSVVNSILAASYFAKYVGGVWGTSEWRVTGPTDPAHPGGLIFHMNDYDPPRNRAGVFPAFGIYWANGETFIERYADDPEFMQIMHDQTAFAFCGDGPLTQAALLARHDELVADAAPHIHGESRRWSVGSVAAWQTNVAARRAHLESSASVVAQAWEDKGWFDGCNRAPEIDMVVNLVDMVGDMVDVAIATSDPEGDRVTVSATGLPPGLTLSGSTISGTATTPGSYQVSVTATDSQANFTVAEVDWEIVAAGTGVATDLVLNEYNAVSATAGDWVGTDTTFGQRDDNGGDWLEFVVTGHDVDIRGWSVEIWDRDNAAERLTATDTFTFSDHSTLASLPRGTLVMIAEQVPEDVSLDPGDGDWVLVANASDAMPSTLLEATGRSNFDSNRHEMIVIVRDEAANAVGSIAGETFAWRQAQNLTAENVMALCATPTDPQALTHDDYQRLALVSTFGQANECPELSQQLWRLRGGRLGDVDTSGQVEAADVADVLNHLIDQTPDPFDPTMADLDGSGLVDLNDALLLARCVAAGSVDCSAQ